MSSSIDSLTTLATQVIETQLGVDAQSVLTRFTNANTHDVPQKKKKNQTMSHPLLTTALAPGPITIVLLYLDAASLLALNGTSKQVRLALNTKAPNAWQQIRKYAKMKSAKKAACLTIQNATLRTSLKRRACRERIAYMIEQYSKAHQCWDYNRKDYFSRGIDTARENLKRLSPTRVECILCKRLRVKMKTVYCETSDCERVNEGMQCCVKCYAERAPKAGGLCLLYHWMCSSAGVLPTNLAIL